jgi:peptidoglycan/xylan/chitin deacetylase (PgdA/CDA1 family)
LQFQDFPRDLIGHGSSPPNPKWPNNAKIALSFVLNYEEGGEYTVLNGDTHSETHILEAGAGYAPRQNARSITTESEYDFGSRVGVWRIFRLFNSKGIKITIYAIGKALEGNPEVGKIAAESGFDVASHGYRYAGACFEILMNQYGTMAER